MRSCEKNGGACQAPASFSAHWPISRHTDDVMRGAFNYLPAHGGVCEEVGTGGGGAGLAEWSARFQHHGWESDGPSQGENQVFK